MDNLDDSENNAKISDSAYSNSCSNSQSRRSHSSKSTHSGSNSSGSSGYGGKPSTSSSSNNLQAPKKDKESKKKKLLQIEAIVPDVVVETDARLPDPAPDFVAPKEEHLDVIPTPPSVHAQSEQGVENMEICTSERNSLEDEVVSCNTPPANTTTIASVGRPFQTTYSSAQTKRFQDLSRYEIRCEDTEKLLCKDGFSCVISMHDGVVMYTTSSLTSTLGFPKDMWIGRSFIDFVHPKDRNTFASQITNGLAVPKVTGTQEEAESPANLASSMVCRIRRYRGLGSGFCVKERAVGFLPFLLKLTFKNINDGEGKVVYLVIQATPFFSAFKTPNEVVTKAEPFIIRHAANGLIEYVDPESVPYLGYLPQDLAGKDALLLYHPKDLHYLRQVYDTIVKEGVSMRSKPYRMLTQNGDYIRLETEWSSFINPWSKKLEFVIGKHHIIAGPTNPDVFQTPDSEKSHKMSDEASNKAQKLRENIIRTMNEGLTKPAEVAKQQMSKRCQDLASFMESLMEEAPKADEELHLEIQDPDHSYYERDSVMLGGISPHHDHDGQSSTDTPLSYTQLNYNETLQRYFDSHHSVAYEDYTNMVTGENILGVKETRPLINHCMPPVAHNSGDSGEMTCSSDSNGMKFNSNSPMVPLGDYTPIRLTEALLTKHNTEMEKELMKTHRENRTSITGKREKNASETRKKKKEHLARCNASFHPTSAGAANTDQQPHGVKRPSKLMETEAGANKHHCPTGRQTRRKQRTVSTTAAVAQPTATFTSTVGQLTTGTTTAASQWPSTPVNNMNAYIMGMGIPMTGMFPMYYTQPSTTQQMPAITNNQTVTSNQQFQAPTMMMCGQPMYGSPFMYPALTPQVLYPMQQTQMMANSMQYTNTMNPLGLTSSNYEESTEAVSNTLPSSDSRFTKPTLPGNSEETREKTDGESSYSSFYSSFFKTESGSAEDSGEAKNKRSPLLNPPPAYIPHAEKKVAMRKMEPPWMEQVCVTSEMIYKYQIRTKSMDEVLTADKQKMKQLEQPSLVNEQLGQLYLDLQLEGVAARLTLEEGITSSSSSSEETTISVTKSSSRKREYSKLMMIYEEDAPLPPPAEQPVEGVKQDEAPSSSS